MKARGFTIIELLIALALGALVLLVLFRAFAAAVAAEKDTQAQIAGHQQARATAQWIVGIIQASAEIRGGTSGAIELAGIYTAGGARECRGLFSSRLGSLRGTVVYEQRRAPCPDGATSAGGVMIVGSDPTVSTVVTFDYRTDRGPLIDPQHARSVAVGVTVDVDRDGRPDYRLVQSATLRASGVPK